MFNTSKWFLLCKPKRSQHHQLGIFFNLCTKWIIVVIHRHHRLFFLLSCFICSALHLKIISLTSIFTMCSVRFNDARRFACRPLVFFLFWWIKTQICHFFVLETFMVLSYLFFFCVWHSQSNECKLFVWPSYYRCRSFHLNEFNSILLFQVYGRPSKIHELTKSHRIRSQ